MYAAVLLILLSIWDFCVGMHREARVQHWCLTESLSVLFLKTGSLTEPRAHQPSYTVRCASSRDPPSSASPALGLNQPFTQVTQGLMQQALYLLRHRCSPRWSSLMISKDRAMKRKIHFRMQKRWT